MTRQLLDMDVRVAALQRLADCYERGDNVVVCLSGGKDSSACLELAVEAAAATGCLPVKAIHHEEETLVPPTGEYLRRVAARDDVALAWTVHNQPTMNITDRANPYYWVCDPQVDPSLWVHQPPADAIGLPGVDPDLKAQHVHGTARLVLVTGLRSAESTGRRYGIASSGGAMTKPDRDGVRKLRPIYDWTTGDVWRYLAEGHDYNRAYDAMLRYGMPGSKMRLGPPTMNPTGLDGLMTACKAWPDWWDRMVARFPTIAPAGHYGRAVAIPHLRPGESWRECYVRTCLMDAPVWISERAQAIIPKIVERHSVHSTTPFPDVPPCRHCEGGLGSWKALCNAMYLGGDPHRVRANLLPPIQPEDFR